MAAYAIVDSEGNVLNTVEYDGVSQYTPAPGTTLFPIPDDQRGNAEIGGKYLGTTYYRRELTEEELAAEAAQVLFFNQANQAFFIREASDEISMLQDMEEEGDDVAAELAAWKAYRLALRRMDINNPVWPVKPE